MAYLKHWTPLAVLGAVSLQALAQYDNGPNQPNLNQATARSTSDRPTCHEKAC